MLLSRSQESDGWTPELLQNTAVHIIYYMLSSIFNSPSMRITITAIVTAIAVTVIARSVAATPRSAFASSVRTSAHLANLDAALSMRTTNPSPG